MKRKVLRAPALKSFTVCAAPGYVILGGGGSIGAEMRREKEGEVKIKRKKEKAEVKVKR
jgi:hypothetical protein